MEGSKLHAAVTEDFNLATSWKRSRVPPYSVQLSELAKNFKHEGLDMLSVSVGFSTPKAAIPWAPAFLAPIAERVRREAGIAVSSAWGIDTPELADRSVKNGQLDLVMVGRAHLADPHWPYHAARKLGIERPSWTLPAPYAHWLERYAVA